MERIVQFFDDFDDLIAALGLLVEGFRNLVFSLAIICASLAFQVGGIILALSHPPLALATALLMFVTLLYRSVTVPFADRSRST